MLVNLGQPNSGIPLLPTGSLIETNGKFGHELIAGPIVGNQQVVGHKEPGSGAHPEFIGSAARRYPFARVIPPVNNEHGMVSWQRMRHQFGDPWAPLDNCQHAARRAYLGRAESPTVTLIFMGLLALPLFMKD